MLVLDREEILERYKIDHNAAPVISVIHSQEDDAKRDYSSEWRHFILAIINEASSYIKQTGTIGDSGNVLKACIDNAKSFFNLTENNVGSDNFYITVLKQIHINRINGILTHQHYLEVLENSMMENCYDIAIDMIFDKILKWDRKKDHDLYVAAALSIRDFNKSSNPNRKYEVGICFFEKADSLYYDGGWFVKGLSEVQKFKNECSKKKRELRR